MLIRREVSAAELRGMFWREYIERTTPCALHHFHVDGVDGVFRCRASLFQDGAERKISGEGNGPIAAFVEAVNALPYDWDVRVLDYNEHALSSGGDAIAAAYVECAVRGEIFWGVGLDANIVTASLKAVVSAINRA